MDAAELVDRYCLVWSEPDPASRARLLASVWALGATYTDPTVDLVGAEALLEHIARVQQTRPGSRVRRTSLVDVHHSVARFSWHVVEAGGRALPDGLDVLCLSADRTRIERVFGFFGPLK